MEINFVVSHMIELSLNFVVSHMTELLLTVRVHDTPLFLSPLALVRSSGARRLWG